MSSSLFSASLSSTVSDIPPFFRGLIETVKTCLTTKGFNCFNVYADKPKIGTTPLAVTVFKLRFLFVEFGIKYTVEFYVKHDEYISSVGEFRLFDSECKKLLLKVSTSNLEAIEKPKLVNEFCDNLELLLAS